MYSERMLTLRMSGGINQLIMLASRGRTEDTKTKYLRYLSAGRRQYLPTRSPFRVVIYIAFNLVALSTLLKSRFLAQESSSQPARYVCFKRPSAEGNRMRPSSPE